MLFTTNLENIIFNRHNLVQTDELIVLSGYLWPHPVSKLSELPFPSKVIYWMYWSEGIQNTLHKSLRDIQERTPPTLNIFYSQIPVHSKCYVWRKNNEIIHALIWSANFSTNGLTTPFREVLAETTVDTFEPLNSYIKHVLDNSISCLEVQSRDIVSQQSTILGRKCLLTLLWRNWEIQNAAWLNRWQNPRNHTTPDDAYIPIRIQDILDFPDLFPPKQINPTADLDLWRRQRHNDSIDIIRDDWYTMQGLLEGSQKIWDIVYPKQISSFPNKNELWIYMKNRLWVPLGQPVRKHHLETYGKLNVEVTLLWDGVYSFNFWV